MSTASVLENVNPRNTVEQFDKEFQRYTTKQVRPCRSQVPLDQTSASAHISRVCE